VRIDFYWYGVLSNGDGASVSDGSKGGVDTGFGVYHSGGPESSFRLMEPNGVFNLEISAIFVALIQIRAPVLVDTLS
jgi:hypothetical protein